MPSNAANGTDETANVATVVSQQPGTTRAESPHRTINFAESAVDAADSAIKKPVTSGAELLNQLGAAKVLLAFFLVTFLFLGGALLGGGMLIRNDFLANSERDRESHKENLKSVLDRDIDRDSHWQTRHQALVAAFKELRDATHEQNQLHKDGNATQQKVLEEMRKLVNKTP